jgi:SynChlorMet cassette radical SAM/SPASM protein ScmE
MGEFRPQVINSPREIDVELTSHCNLRCRYCYFFNNPGVEYSDLSTAAWLKFFAECGAAGVMRLRLAGGEPFYREDILELIAGVVKNRMRFSLLSNGGLITDERAAFIARTGRCDSIQISLDGGRAEIHDSVRGRGAFAQAVRGIKLLRHHGIPVAVRCTIHRHNVDYLEETAAFILEELELSKFSTNAAGYFGLCQNNAADLMLTIEDRVKAMRILDRLDRIYPGRIEATAGPLADLKSWRRMEEMRSRGDAHFSNLGVLSGCGCHLTKIGVRSDGHFTVCNMINGISLGAINRERLVEIWKDHPVLAQFRNRRKISLRKFVYCRECDFADYCTGNCPAAAFTLTGDPQQPAPDSCYRRFLAAGGRLPPVPDNFKEIN